MTFSRLAAGSVLAFSLLLPPLAYGQQPTRKPAPATKSKAAAAKPVAKPAKPADEAPVRLPAGVKLVESWRPEPGELGIAYQKFLLTNGLTILVHEDHSDPAVHVSVAYHTGSAREVAGRSGFAHFYEHMMFEGSEHVPAGEHFKTIEGAGGNLNGFTQQDQTVYFEMVPVNYLETTLWLEADRMGFLHNAVTQERFENQRATVKNERGQNWDNQPYGRSYEVVGRALYPPEHPYSWPTIGYEEDLNAATVQDLKSFLLRWYGPNNATLTIAGDVEPMRAAALAARYFSTIPTGPAVTAAVISPVRILQDRYVSYQDNAAELPMLRFVFPTVPRSNPDEPALDALATLLGSGKTSILHQRLVKTQLAVDANAYQSNSELGGEFVIEARPNAGHTLSELDVAIRAALQELGIKPVTENDLARFRAQRESSLAQRLSEINGRGLLLAEWQTMAGSPKALTEHERHYRDVKASDLSRVFGQYLQDHAAVVLSVLPRQRRDIGPARPDNFTPPPRPVASPDAATGLSYQAPAADFDRTKAPAVGQAPAPHVPTFWSTTLPNGLKVLGAKSGAAPIVQMELTLEGGHQLLSPNKVGLAALTADILNESSAKYTAEAFDARLEELGASVDVAANRETMTVRASGLSRNLQPTLALLAERLLHPRFDTAEFRRARQRAIAQLADRYASPGATANQVFRRTLYGPQHPFGHPVEGYANTLGPLKLDDVRAFYKQQFTPQAATLVVVGDVSKEQFLAALGELKSWSGSALKLPTLPALPPQRSRPIIVINARSRAPQTEIRVGCRALPYDATGPYFRSTLLNVPIAGSFSSRLNRTLREEKGWTYGIGGGFGESRANGTYRLAASVRSDVAQQAITEILRQLDSVRTKGLTDAEVAFTKKFVGQTEALRYASPWAKLDLLGHVARYNLPADFPRQQQAILQAITRAELNKLAAERLATDQMVVVLVGPNGSLGKRLGASGYDVTEVTADGNPTRNSQMSKMGAGEGKEAGLGGEPEQPVDPPLQPVTPPTKP